MEPLTGKLGLDIFLWICLAVAAGFFGYLGRRLMERLLTRRKAKQSAAPELPPAQDTPALQNPELELERERLKAEKKKAKAEVKKAKKAAKD